VEEGRSESCEDEVGEEIDVEDWREELGGGQAEVISKKRVFRRGFSGRERHRL
jgi:hypothetical protein